MKNEIIDTIVYNYAYEVAYNERIIKSKTNNMLVKALAKEALYRLEVTTDNIRNGLRCLGVKDFFWEKEVKKYVKKINKAYKERT